MLLLFYNLVDKFAYSNFEARFFNYKIMRLIVPKIYYNIGDVCPACSIGKLEVRKWKQKQFLICSECKFSTNNIIKKTKKEKVIEQKEKIKIDEKNEEEIRKTGIPRRKDNYFNSKAEQKFNQSFQQYLPNFTITKRGFADFMILDENNNCIGFIEVKKYKEDKLKLEQEIFKRFCKKYNIPYMVWYSSVSNEIKKRKQIKKIKSIFFL